jgi:hypothetical protein
LTGSYNQLTTSEEQRGAARSSEEQGARRGAASSFVLYTFTPLLRVRGVLLLLCHALLCHILISRGSAVKSGSVVRRNSPPSHACVVRIPNAYILECILHYCIHILEGIYIYIYIYIYILEYIYPHACAAQFLRKRWPISACIQQCCPLSRGSAARFSLTPRSPASTTSCTTTRVGTMRSISSRSQRRVQRDQAKATSTIRWTTPPSRSQRRPLRLHVQQCRLPGEHQLTLGLRDQYVHRVNVDTSYDKPKPRRL